MTKTLPIVVIGLVLLSLIMACTPKSTPSPTSVPPAANPVPANPIPATPSASPKDTNWDNVVEAAKKEGHLTLYPSAYFTGDKGQIVAKAFQDRYGFKPEFLIITGPQAVEKVKVEARMNQRIGDIVPSGESTTTQLSQAGLTASVWQELPELRDKSVFKSDPIFNPNGDIISFSLKINGPAINTDLVKFQDEPRSYFDLLEPKWKGKVLLEDPRSGGGTGFTWFSALLYYKVLDADYYRRFAKQEPILWGGSSTEAFRMVARGEAWLTPYAADSNVGYLIVEGAPMKILGMKEGNVATSDVMTVIKGATHPNAAKLFLNWMLSREGQEVYARAGSLESMRKDVASFLDPRVKMQPEPQKLLPRTYDMAQIINQYHKDGIAEGIFGKK
ncbi:MAG: Ferric transporter ATP-binding subunit [Dehalococcoidia bacterium]|nr:Ferric transporter ATP-binding subunit [Dehalococcoidia bacterium]